MGLLFWLSLFFASALIILYAQFKLVGSRYWQKRNVPHLQPTFLIGNLWRMNVTEHFIHTISNLHVKHKEMKLVGLWNLMKPVIMVTDLELAKRILIRDFSCFRDRGFEFDEERDPLAGHLFSLSGVKWRNLRVRLTPTFTSGKMKMMFSTMLECGDQLEAHLDKSVGQEVEVKDLLARFTTDIISSCAFGIQTNSLANPNSEFRVYGRKMLDFGWWRMLVFTIMTMCPKLLKLLKIPITPRDVTNFFVNAVRETVEHREKNNVTRNDFLQLLIQIMRVGKVEDVDCNPVDTTGYTDEELVFKFELNQVAAQCFIFFIAGFETTASAMTFALYELALNPSLQSKLQKNIDEVLEKHGRLTYDALYEMDYLDMVVNETLRKYPPAVVLQRISNASYHIPEFNATLDKGTMVMISVKGFHEDPDLFPEPGRFDPERFIEQEKTRRHPMAFMPFGEGPRNCIGNRFAMMQMKVGLVSVFRHFNVEICKKTPVPLKFNPRVLSWTPEGGMPLLFTKRK